MASCAPASACPIPADERVQDAEVLAATVRKVFGPQVHGAGAVRAVLVGGPPGRVLVQLASGALLLALGRRAHGQYGQPAIGAVGRACLRNAAVPVVAVPATERVATPLGAVAAPSLARSGAA
ncbi:universal stress protein [Streptomyces sp. NPDC019531]|uniref:universal stress protein n=1 Tax=Streptomyces sp. NPDC019531 TaxID=3365062 RepID=UPI00384B658E